MRGLRWVKQAQRLVEEDEWGTARNELHFIGDRRTFLESQVQRRHLS